MNRRTFIARLGGVAATWPLAARAQQPAMPVIGFLNGQSPGGRDHLLAALKQGLGEAGYVEGRNVAIEYRWAENQNDRLPALATDLVRRQVAAIIATGGGITVALAAKAATSAIPIVFAVPQDPVKFGLVKSLARPGGNATGMNFLVGEIVAKRLGLMRELLPSSTRIALLVNPANAENTESTLRDTEVAARAIGLQIYVFKASTSAEINAAFANLVRERVDAIFVAPDGFYLQRRVQLVTLATRVAIPTVFAVRDYVEIGGLMSYGTNLTDLYRQLGVYAGRILKGANPADLPVFQSSKFEFVINLQTAKALGIEIPPMLLAHADQVIE
jgi:putative ABC transport system substrate-binding protein